MENKVPSEDGDLHAFLLKRLAEERLSHAEELHTLKTECRTLQHKLRDSNAFSTGQASIIHELQEKCNELAWLKGDAEDALAAVDSGDFRTLQRDIMEARSYSSAVASENTSLLAELDAVKSTHSGLQSALRLADKRLLELEESHGAERSTLVASLEEARLIAQNAESRGTLFETQSNSLSSQLESVTRERNELFETLVKVRQSGEEEMGKLGDVLTSSGNELESARGVAMKLAGELGAANAEIGVLTAEVNALKHSLACLQTSFSELARADLGAVAGSSTWSVHPPPSPAPLPDTETTRFHQGSAPPSAFKRLLLRNSLDDGSDPNNSMSLQKTPGYKKARAGTTALRKKLGLHESIALSAENSSSAAARASEEFDRLRAVLEDTRAGAAASHARYEESLLWLQESQSFQNKLQEELSQAKLQLNLIEEEKNGALTNLESLKSQANDSCTRLQADLDAVRADFFGLQDAYSKSQTELSRVEGSLCEAQTAYNSVFSAFETSKSESALALQSALTQARENLEEGFNSKWASAMEEAEARFKSQMDFELSSLRASLESSEAGLQAAQLSVRVAQSELLETRGKLEELSSENRSLVRGLEEARLASDATLSERESVRRIAFEEGLKAGGDRVAEIEARLISLSSLLESETQQKDFYGQRTTELDSALKDVHTLLSEKESSLFGALERIAELEAHVARVQGELGGVSRHNISLEDNVQELTRRVFSSQTAQQAAEFSLSEVREAHALLEEQNRLWREKLSSDLTESVYQKEQALAELANFRSLLESGAYFPASEIESRVASRVAALETETGTLAAESQRRLADEAVQAAVARVKTEYSSRLAKVEAEKQEVIAKLKEMSAAGKAIKFTLAENHSNQGTLVQEKSALENRVSLLENDLRASQESHSAKVSEIQAMELRFREAWEAEAFRRDSEASALMEQVEKSSSEARNFYLQLTKTVSGKEELEREVAQLRAQLSSVSETLRVQTSELLMVQQQNQQQQLQLLHLEQQQQQKILMEEQQLKRSRASSEAVCLPGSQPNPSALEVSLMGLGEEQRKILEEQEQSWLTAMSAIPTGNLERLNEMYTQWVTYCSDSLLDTEGLPAMVGLVSSDASPEESKNSVHLWRTDSLDILAKEIARLSSLLVQHASVTVDRSPGAQSTPSQQFTELWNALIDGLREDIKGWFGPPAEELEFPLASSQVQPAEIPSQPLNVTASALPSAPHLPKEGTTPARQPTRIGQSSLLSPRRTLPRSLQNSPSGKISSDEAFPITLNGRPRGDSLRSSPLTLQQGPAADTLPTSLDTAVLPDIQQSSVTPSLGEQHGGTAAAPLDDVAISQRTTHTVPTISSSAPPAFEQASSCDEGADSGSNISPPPADPTFHQPDTEGFLLEAYSNLLRDKESGLAAIRDEYNRYAPLLSSGGGDLNGENNLASLEKHCAQQWSIVETKSEEATNDLVLRLARVYGYPDLDSDNLTKLKVWMHERVIAELQQRVGESSSLPEPQGSAPGNLRMVEETPQAPSAPHEAPSPQDLAVSSIAALSTNTTLVLPPTNLISVFNSEETAALNNTSLVEAAYRSSRQGSPKRPLTPPTEYEGKESMPTTMPQAILNDPLRELESAGDTPPIKSRAAYRKILEYQASSRFPTNQSDADAWVSRKYSSWLAVEGAGLPENDFLDVGATQPSRRGRARTGSSVVSGGSSVDGGLRSRRGSIGPGGKRKDSFELHQQSEATQPTLLNSRDSLQHQRQFSSYTDTGKSETTEVSEKPRAPQMFFVNPAPPPLWFPRIHPFWRQHPPRLSLPEPPPLAAGQVLAM